MSLADYRGQVLLIVNTASKCGFTPQYEGLEKLYEDLHPKGLTVLGFPCNQFGAQEPGSADEIGQFCQVNYGVSFPMFAKIDVNGASAHPLYEYLKHEKTRPARQPHQLELHQVPDRPRGQGDRALCADDKAEGSAAADRAAVLSRAQRRDFRLE